MQFTETVTLTKIDCGSCGATYAINERYREKKWEEGGSWRCPYCHCWWGYGNNNENAQLKKQLEAKEREIREAKCETLRQQQLRDSEAAARLKAEKKLRRVGKGVCPCCNRHFTNLERHMATKHPEKKP